MDRQAEAKPVWVSRTVWVNVLTAAAAVGTAVGIDHGLDAETQTAIVAGIMAVQGVIMRVLTSRPVTIRRQ